MRAATNHYLIGRIDPRSAGSKSSDNISDLVRRSVDKVTQPPKVGGTSRLTRHLCLSRHGHRCGVASPPRHRASSQSYIIRSFESRNSCLLPQGPFPTRRGLVSLISTLIMHAVQFIDAMCEQPTTEDAELCSPHSEPHRGLWAKSGSSAKKVVMSSILMPDYNGQRAMGLEGRKRANQQHRV